MRLSRITQYSSLVNKYIWQVLWRGREESVMNRDLKESAEI